MYINLSFTVVSSSLLAITASAFCLTNLVSWQDVNIDNTACKKPQGLKQLMSLVGLDNDRSSKKS